MSASSMRASVLAKMRRPPTFARMARNLIFCLAVAFLSASAALRLDGILAAFLWVEAAYYAGCFVIALLAFAYIGVGSLSERAS